MGRTWEVLKRSMLDKSELEALFRNEIAAITVPGFVDPTICATAAAAITQHDIDHYRHVTPRIGRIGITQTEARHEREDRAAYLEGAENAHAARKAIFAAAGDPVTLVLCALRKAWSGNVGIAVEPDGQQYFAGLVRIVTEALIHCDWAPHDAHGWAIARVTAQLAWNIYYEVPERGGSIVVYDLQWTPKAQAFANQGNYGFRAEIVAGRRFHEIRPNPGDLVIFNSRNFHSVGPSNGRGRRISAGSFIGLLPESAELVLWS